MKTKIILFASLILTLNACDFLDIPPQNFLSSAAFYETEEDFEQAINGAYAGLYPIYNEDYIMGEIRSDNTHYIFKSGDRGGQNVQREQIADFMEDPSNRYTNNRWSNSYILIARTNQILSSIEKPVFSETVKKNIKGQALFLRAFTYFYLVQYFGDVPLHLVPSTGLHDVALPKTPINEIYKQIVADLNEATILLPTKKEQTKGRVTNGTANMLLAHIYMTLKQYVEAETVLKELILSQQYALLADYSSIFELSNKNSSESIFEIQYLQGTMGIQSNFIYKFIPGLLDTKELTGVYGNNQSFGGWNTPTDDLLQSYELGDKRKEASIGYYVDEKGNSYPYVKKYLHSHLNFDNTDDNWPVYRYANALLLLAEALNEQDKSAEAITYINNVFGETSIRARAGLNAITTSDQHSLRELIIKERRIELAFENHRWLDLVRTGKAVEVLSAYGQKVKASPQKYYYPDGSSPLPQSYNVNENHLKFPIPDRQIVLNPLLK